jgi:hypothetical protein
MRALLVFLTLAVGAIVLFAPRGARAAPPWVDRHLTLPRGDWAFDFGLGVGHARLPDPAPEDTAAGVNVEMAVGVADRLQIGLRTGVRFGDDFERSIRADQYGRLFDRQTFATGPSVLANPELRVDGAVVRGRVAEIALEGRIVFPFETGTDAGLLFGVPFAFHLGDRVRLDVGVYVPIVVDRPTADVAVDVPVDIWIQASARVWLGPMTGLAFRHVVARPAPLPGPQNDFSLGFGFGYEIVRYLDFKAMVLFPTIAQDSRLFGAGAGVELRIE